MGQKAAAFLTGSGADTTMPRMNTEIARLEDRLEQLIQRFEQGRSELRAAHERIAALESEKQALLGKVATACERVEALLESMPQQQEGEDGQ